MLNRIDSTPTASSGLINTQQTTAKEGAKQVFPARSALDQAQSALKPGTALPAAMLQPTSLAEVLEDAGFALHQHRSESRQGPRGMQRPRAQSMLQQLVQQMKDHGDARLEDLLKRIPHVDNEEDLADSMRRGGFDAGEIALLLAALAADEKRKDSARRRRLEAALDQVMEDDQWALQLFCSLEFGLQSAANLAALKHLYQRATGRQTRLTQWFDEFRRLPDRRRKLRALIRALAFELSAQEAVTDAQLAAVITDLKRVLHFFSIEDHCGRVAEQMGPESLNSEAIMLALLDTIQQPWIYADWLDERTRRDLPGDQPRHVYARHLKELTKLLPEDCFDNIEQRDSILDTFNEFLDRLDNEE
ncbi:YopN family type III secretion system gatekeeper subunit [Pseudomonas aeruginosa]|nr:YopN family type III secretion system gatekeeper subunit [Pseudomonas aeruginosa]